ncbi:MAG: hypothetical protein EOO66_25015 [Methylobacterium sp.]|nr:MAG: hypothetical protein EOO66_25015 [Methylobacterium sp.]
MRHASVAATWPVTPARQKSLRPPEPMSRSVKAGALMDKPSLPALSGPGAPYLVSGRPWPSLGEIERKARALMADMFDRALPGRDHPSAIVTIGVMGSGKSTAVKQLRRKMPGDWRPAYIDPDAVAVKLLGGAELPSGGDLYDLASKWTRRIWDHAVRNRYNLVYDAPVPSTNLLKTLRRAGYAVELLLVRAGQPVARRREVARDLRRGWGRPGVSQRGHLSTQADISKNGPAMAARYADRLTVCDNSGKVMKCMDMGDPRQVRALGHEFRA